MAGAQHVGGSGHALAGEEGTFRHEFPFRIFFNILRILPNIEHSVKKFALSKNVAAPLKPGLNRYKPFHLLKE